MQDATNNCEKIKELLSAYRDLELAQEESAQVERHLSLCEECTREASAIETVAATLSQVPRVSMKVDMADRLEALIAAQANELPTEQKVEDKEQKVVPFNKRRKFEAKDLVWGSLAAAAAAILLVAVPFFTANNQIANNDVKQQAPVKEEAPQNQPLMAKENSPSDTTNSNESIVPAPNAVATHGGVSSSEKQNVQKPMISNNDTAAPAPVAVKSQTSVKVAQKPRVDATLDTIDETEALIAFSSDDNMFEDCGISTDEDGLYAIKM